MTRWRNFLSGLKTWLRAVWRVLNSPIAITLVSGLLIASITREYSARDAAQRDLEARRNKLAVALTEFQQRMAYIQAADRLWKGRCDYPKASEKEWEAITATGSYVPTSPAYRNIHLNVVINEVEASAGIPDVRFGSELSMGTFSIQPPRTAWWVRGQLPWLNQYGQSRSFLLATGSLPLPSGETPSDLVNTMLELPGSTPALRAKLERETDELAKRVLNELERPGKNLPPCHEPSWP